MTVTSRISSEIVPTPNAGVKPWIGKRNPVTLVRMVMTKNNNVQPAMRCDRNMPTTTMRPLTMATRLMMT